jgi:hypothetical protein
MIEANGAQFDVLTWCVFDTFYISKGIYLNSSIIHCKSLPHIAGIVSMEFMIIDKYVSQFGTTFEYYFDESIF